MKCPNCSAELNDNARFCPQCGASIDSTDDALSNHNPIPEHETVSPRRSGGNRAQRRAGKRNKKPDNSKKKPLIIAIIALVLVIAIVLGVIFFVSRKTVSAKELQKAKDNYLPPAQAVTIDTSLSDPSNDAIQFKYDDHARIISCTYSVNKMTYDQRYTYDENMRKINVETTYRAQPIFTKELDYDRVTKPDTFEEVDGYYIRLCKEDLPDTGATDPPQETAAPEATEPPTDPPTEEPTEEPTDPTADWKELYIDYLDHTEQSCQSGKLFYINDDDIPEMLLFCDFGARTRSFDFCWINNGIVQHETIVTAGLQYQERTGKMTGGSSGGEGYTGWWVTMFNGSSLTQIRNGHREVIDINTPNQTIVYKIDDEEVSEEEYISAIKETQDWTQMYNADTWTDASSLPDYIRNY